MADDLNIAGTDGQKLATDVVTRNGAAEHQPIAKVALGGEGAFTGFLGDDPLPVTFDGFPLTITAELSATDNAVLDSIDSSTSRLLSSATRIAPGSALATTSLVSGSRHDSTQKTLTDGQEAAFAMSARGAMIVTPGVETFNIGALPAGTNLIGKVSIDQATAGANRVIAQNYLLALAEGDISGHTMFAKLGYNAAVGATEEDIWEPSNVYVFPAAPMQMEIVSSNAADALAGTGVQKVKITYLDNTYAQQTEVISLNGATPVPTVATNILRVNSIRATQVGTGKVAAGTITCRMIGGAATVYRDIQAGFTRGRSLIYTVPLGKILYCTSIAVSSGHTTPGKVVRWTGRATMDDTDYSIINFFQPFFEMITMDNSFVREFEIPVKFPATCDIKMSATSDGATSFAVCAMRGWIE